MADSIISDSISHETTNKVYIAYFYSISKEENCTSNIKHNNFIFNWACCCGIKIFSSTWFLTKNFMKWSLRKKMDFLENRFQNCELHHVFAVLAWQKSNDFLFTKLFKKAKVIELKNCYNYCSRRPDIL